MLYCLFYNFVLLPIFLQYSTCFRLIPKCFFYIQIWFGQSWSRPRCPGGAGRVHVVCMCVCRWCTRGGCVQERVQVRVQVVYQVVPSVRQVSTRSPPRVDQVSTRCRPGVHQVPTRCPPSVHQVSTRCPPRCPPRGLQVSSVNIVLTIVPSTSTLYSTLHFVPHTSRLVDACTVDFLRSKNRCAQEWAHSHTVAER